MMYLISQPIKKQNGIEKDIKEYSPDQSKLV
jgi:hypothetical protein